MNLFKKITSNVYIKSSILILFLSNLGLGIQYFSQILLGRFLSSEEYVIFNSLTGIGMVACSISTVYPYILSRYSILATNQSGSNGLIAVINFSKLLFKISIVICIILSILLPMILNYFNKISLNAYFLTISLIFLGYIYFILLGLYQS